MRNGACALSSTPYMSPPEPTDRESLRALDHLPFPCQCLLLAAFPGESCGFCRVSVLPQCHSAWASAWSHTRRIEAPSPWEHQRGWESQQHRVPHTAPGTVPSPDVLRWSLSLASTQPSQPHRSCHWGRWQASGSP